MSETLDELQAAGVQLAAADAARAVAIERITAAVRRAHAEGVPITEIMREAGISRPTIYRMLRG